jgi:serine/threonine protein kinase
LRVFNGRFETLRQISAGPYFDTFFALDRRLPRPVFVKMSRASIELDLQPIIEAHVEQWRKLAKLSIRELPAIYDVFQEEDSWFLVTQWVDHPSLSDLIDRRWHPDYPGRFLDTLVERCLTTLKAVHGRGIIHGDISPSNILLNPNDLSSEIFFVDPAPALNMADPKDASRRLILAKRRFTAPEVLLGGPLSEKSDLFSLGRVIADVSLLLGVGRPSGVVEAMIANHVEDRPFSADKALKFGWVGVEAMPSPIDEDDASVHAEMYPTVAPHSNDDKTAVIAPPRPQPPPGEIAALEFAPQVAAVPEPSTWAMMILGFLGIGTMAYRRRKGAMLAA